MYKCFSPFTKCLLYVFEFLEKNTFFFVNILFSTGESLWMGSWVLSCLFEILTILSLLIVSLKHIYLHNMGQPIIRSIRTLHNDGT